MEEKNLTLYEFRCLSEKEQYHMVFTAGDFIDSVTRGSNTFMLYSLNRFFVEVVYHSPTNKILKKQAFLTGRIIDKYVPFRDKKI